MSARSDADYVYVYLPKQPPLVVWPPMSAVVTVVRNDGIVIVADRRTVLGPRTHGRGSAPIGDDAPKLSMTAGGCVWALAGHAATTEVDLRDVLSADTARDPAVAARQIRHRFDDVAERIRAGVWDEQGAPIPELFTAAHAVAVIAGVADGRPEAHLVALTVEGPAQSTVLGVGAIHVLAPPPLNMQLPLVLEPAAASASLTNTADELVEVVRRAAQAEPDLVSLDVDQAVLTLGGSAPQFTHRPMPPSES